MRWIAAPPRNRLALDNAAIGELLLVQEDLDLEASTLFSRSAHRRPHTPCQTSID